MHPTNYLISRESIVQKLNLEMKMRKFVNAQLQSAGGMLFYFIVPRDSPLVGNHGSVMLAERQ